MSLLRTILRAVSTRYVKFNRDRKVVATPDCKHTSDDLDGAVEWIEKQAAQYDDPKCFRQHVAWLLDPDRSKREEP